MLQDMVNDFGQAWFDGNKSIRTWINPEITYPFWLLDYWDKMLDALEAKDAWLRAAQWLSETGATEEESELKLAVQGIWSVAGGHGKLSGLPGLPAEHLAKLFLEDYLDSRIIDAMLTLLSLRSRVTDNNNSTDVELSIAYEIAEQLFMPYPDPDFEELYLNEDADITQAAEFTAAEELHCMVDSLKDATNISRVGDAELDACVMASVALSMEELDAEGSELSIDEFR
ncbi:hypothetical protein B0H11DRAFT_2218192 [Mycena galericulata]|nr:hypothetical protein B0H11DRAFT_2218192 [Mycena galericulata]